MDTKKQKERLPLTVEEEQANKKIWDEYVERRRLLVKTDPSAAIEMLASMSAYLHLFEMIEQLLDDHESKPLGTFKSVERYRILRERVQKLQNGELFKRLNAKVTSDHEVTSQLILEKQNRMHAEGKIKYDDNQTISYYEPEEGEIGPHLPSSPMQPLEEEKD